MLFSPVILAIYHYTQSAGLLNVFGAFVTVMALAMNAAVVVLVLMYIRGQLPDMQPNREMKTSKAQRSIGAIVTILVCGYLFWNGHFYIGTVYAICFVLASFMWAFIRVMSDA